jgi:hypothetical protein
MNEIVWAFDLGKASIGEAVRDRNKFPHKASPLVRPHVAPSPTSKHKLVCELNFNALTQEEGALSYDRHEHRSTTDHH